MNSHRLQQHSHFLIISLALLLCILPGCFKYNGPKYTPTFNLTKTSTSIPLKVLLRPLADNSPAEDKESGYMLGSGSSATSKETLTGNLASMVTTSFQRGLLQSNVFETLNTDVSTPDLILSGTIHRFYERTTQPLIGLCCGLLTGMIGLPLMIEEGAVDIELTLLTPDSTVVKTYRERADYNKWMNGYDRRAWGEYSHGPYLNKTFGEVAAQLRDAILADKNQLMTSKASP